MTWQTVIKARPFMTDAERKFSAKATAALDASVPMDIEDSIKSKKQLTRLISKVKRYEGEEFEDKFRQAGWDASDREGILQILIDARKGLSESTKDNQPHIADKIQAFLDGNHEELLELIERSKNKALIHLIQQWNKKNGDELREYLRENTELADKFKKVFTQLEPVGDRQKEVSTESIGDELVYDYVKMIVNDLSKVSNIGNEHQMGKASYLPIRDAFNTKLALKVFGLGANQSGSLPPATSYILRQEDIDLEQFLAVADTKTSTKKEIVLNRLRNSKLEGDLQDTWDASKTLSAFENTVASNRDLTQEFRELMEGLGAEMKVEDVTTEVKYSIPKDAYEKIMAGHWDESLKVYGINSDDALEEMMYEHKEDLASFKEKVSGFYRPVDGETKKRLENSEVLTEEGIELWDSNTGQLKELSSSMASGKAFPQYLENLSKVESKTKAVIEAAEGNKNQVMIGDFILYLARTEMTFADRDSDVKRAVVGYTKAPSEETKQVLLDEISSTKYKEIRRAMLDSIKEKISSLLKDYDSNYLHEKGGIEPLEWLWERL